MEELRKPSLFLIVMIVAACAAGAWISGELVQSHAGLWSQASGGGGLFARVCRASQSLGFDCADTSRSDWSEFTVPIPLPSRSFSVHVHRVVVPVAFMGLAYFVFVGAWFALAGAERGSLPRSVIWLVRFGALFSIACLTLMAIGAAPLCLWCLLTHGLSLLLMAMIERSRVLRKTVASGGVIESDVERLAVRRAGRRACAVAILLVVGLWFHRHEQLALGSQIQSLLPYRAIVSDLRNDPDFLLREHFAQVSNELGSDLRVGDARGVPVVTVFTDYECSACACASIRLDSLVSPAFDGVVSIDIRHYPLDVTCNDAVADRFHSNACEAAYAAEAARMQGEDAFREFSATLHAHRHELSPELYRQLAQESGLDLERFSRDLAGDDVRRIVQEDVSMARRLGVDGTPAMFLNGRRVSEFGTDNPVFWDAIAARERLDSGAIRVSAN